MKQGTVIPFSVIVSFQLQNSAGKGPDGKHKFAVLNKLLITEAFSLIGSL